MRNQNGRINLTDQLSNLHPHSRVDGGEWGDSRENLQYQSSKNSFRLKKESIKQVYKVTFFSPNRTKSFGVQY